MNTALVAIDKLPITPDTLWLRLLGKADTLKQAIEELIALPPDDNHRSQVLELLVNWRISLQLESPRGIEERELMATLSQAYLEWEQRTRAEGEQLGLARERALILRLVNLHLGELPPPMLARLEQLPLEQLETLSEALLGFQSVADLENWLSH
jgi:hypothetical protein